MGPLKISIIHQWWLEHEELCSLLFAADPTHIVTRFYPHYTDCSESIYSIESLDANVFSKAFLHSFLLDDILAKLTTTGAFQSNGKALDKRVITIYMTLD